ncbi:MAG: Gfo/Idh/MocA family oxidoreductase [Oscillospiraceae bacterium]|nr:Gfo/Idh/MocA family oxidoreductase [Oscillospiraceae bacterium]
MSTEKLKLAVIGTGFAWDRLHYPALRELSDKYEITAVCNKTIDKAQSFAQGINLPPDRVYSNYSEMLRRDDIDVVDVLVPISENFEVARDVLLAGKNLIAEKPFAATLDGANELLEIKNRNNLKVMVAENYRYDDGNRIIKDIISSGKIGEVTHFTLDKSTDFPTEMLGDTFSAKEWRQHPNFNGGIFLDSGVHDVALMRFLFGDVACVYAVGRPQDEDFCPYSVISTLLTFKNSVTGSYTFRSTAKALVEPPIGLRIFGTLGEIYLESKECGVVNVRYKDGRSEDLNYTPERGYYNELLNFYDGNIVSTPEKEIGDIALVFDILKSMESSEVIHHG